MPAACWCAAILLALASCTDAMNSGDCAVCAGIKSIQAAFSLLKRVSIFDEYEELVVLRAARLAL